MAKTKQSLINAKHLLALAFAILVSGLILRYDAQLREMAGLSYLGVFLFMFFGNATLFLPTPGLFLVYILGGQLNPLALGLCAGLGGVLGELVGYALGYASSGYVTTRATYQRISDYIEKYDMLAIAVVAFIPNPFFDIAGIASGALKIPWQRFTIAAFLGLTAKTILIAFAGAYSLEWIKNIFP